MGDVGAMGGNHVHELVRRQNAGENRGGGSSSISGLVSTLIPTLIIAVIAFTGFLILSRRFKRIYQPRTYIESLRGSERSPKQSAGILGWRNEYNALKDEFILGHSSIDNYLWLRFFKMLTLMCLVGCIVTWPILFPVNATSGGGQSGLDILSFSNVLPGPRYYAQALVAWVFLAWVMFMITRETIYLTHLRQRYYQAPYNAARLSTRTVLFTNLPEDARNEQFLRAEFAGAKHVWLVTVPDDLADKVSERDTAAAKLETGEVKMIQGYVKAQLKKEKKGQESRARLNGAAAPTSAIELTDKERPKHRLPVLKFLPFGKKVDTLDWSRGELRRLIPEVTNEQHEQRRGAGEAKGACFVEFATVEAAEAALRSSKEKKKSKIRPEELGMHPDNVLWKNTTKKSAQVKIMSALCTAFVWFLCIFWTIPVAVIGAISNINYLTDKVPFLSFINDIPDVVLGVVTGLLPVILLAVLMALVPIIMNILAGLFEPTQGRVQMKVQGWYFPFQVIQVFLVTTFASGAASVVTQIINDPTQAPTLLAQNLPKASNFYISFFILFGLMNSAMMMLNIVPLLLFIILGKLLDKTPRKMYNRYVNLGGLGWGALYPKFTNLGVIALAYSSIAPLILGFATVCFALLYLAFRYNILFAVGTNVSTRGESYKRALKQLTVGIYISEICLIGLFAIGVGTTNQSIGPLVLMVVFLVATIAWQIWLGRKLSKMDAELPSQIAAEGWLAGRAAPRGSQPDSVTSESALKNGHANEKPDALPAVESSTLATQSGKKPISQRVRAFFAPTSAALENAHSIAPNLSSPPRPYTQQEHDEAYLHPALISEVPMVWIARDQFGLSKQEVGATQAVVGKDLLEVTDEGAWFDDKGKIQWPHEDEGSLRRVPIWEEEPEY